MEIPGGGGHQRPPMEWKFLGDRGVQTENPSVGVGGGGLDSFWNHTMTFGVSMNILPLG